MEQNTITKLNKQFEEYAYEQDGIEYWFARELQELLGYADWRNFLNAVNKAKESCETTQEAVSDHFVDVNKTIPMPKGANKEVPDIMLTRYACYLIAQNGDPKKEQIAFAQSYFAIQTRKQEILEERIQLMERLQAREKLAATETELSKNIFERGVDNKGFEIVTLTKNYFFPRLNLFKVLKLHLKDSHSLFFSSNTKSVGKRFMLFLTERFRYFVSVPYRSAKSQSNITFCPRIS